MRDGHLVIMLRDKARYTGTQVTIPMLTEPTSTPGANHPPAPVGKFLPSWP